MGAWYDEFTIKGGNEKYVKQVFKQRQKEDAFEHGHSYSGAFNMATGIEVKPHLKFKTYEEASEYLTQNCKKWDDAIAVMYRNSEGQLVWLVGAVLAS